MIQLFLLFELFQTYSLRLLTVENYNYIDADYEISNNV